MTRRKFSGHWTTHCVTPPIVFLVSKLKIIVEYPFLFPMARNYKLTTTTTTTTTTTKTIYKSAISRIKTRIRYKFRPPRNTRVKVENKVLVACFYGPRCISVIEEVYDLSIPTTVQSKSLNVMSVPISGVFHIGRNLLILLIASLPRPIVLLASELDVRRQFTCTSSQINKLIHFV